MRVVVYACVQATLTHKCLSPISPPILNFLPHSITTPPLLRISVCGKTKKKKRKRNFKLEWRVLGHLVSQIE